MGRKKEKIFLFHLPQVCFPSIAPKLQHPTNIKCADSKHSTMLSCEVVGAFTFTTSISYSFSSNCRYMVAVVVAADGAAVVTEDDAEGGAAGAAANAAAATAEKSYDDTEDDAEGDGAMCGAFRWSTYILLAVNLGTTPHRLDKSPDLDRSKIRSEKEIESPNSTKSFLIPTTVASRIPVTFKSLAPSPVFNTVIEE
jgi:hypothetical protein